MLNFICLYIIYGLGNLTPGQGYQIKTSASYSQFTFDEFISIPGCIYLWANNYNELATIDDGSCYKMGCTSDWADNYDPLATINDGSCSKWDVWTGQITMTSCNN